MKTLLRIDASARREGSNSRQLADCFERHWQAQYPTSQIVRREIGDGSVPHLAAETILAFQSRGTIDDAGLTLSDTLIGELQAANHIVISTALYNFAIPSPLKAYFDHTARHGHTIAAENGQYRGLLTGRSATVITVRGGLAEQTGGVDPQAEYLRGILGFMGVGPVEIVSLEGTILPEAERDRRLEAAEEEIAALFEAGEANWQGAFTLAEKAAIGRLRRGQAKAILQGDTDAYAALCTEDVQLMIPGQDMISGCEAVREAERRLFERAAFTGFRKTPNRIERSGDLVVETGRQEVTMQNGSGEGVFAVRQKYTHVYRRTDTGWRFAVLMSNPC
ncbi:MAG: NAD(P)H-dependent oxidoreductase [Verrucomicrobiota bacterium JB022]|nr:NAD(P)H-dependent oxidoreductase [Verrucomicrobiota bacterium JB022]